jgi:hypothetical protein
VGASANVVSHCCMSACSGAVSGTSSAASLLIGLLLIVVAYLLMRRNLALLIDEAAPADIRERLRQAVAREPWVAEVAELTAVYVGPRQLLVLAHVVAVDGTELTAGVGRLRAVPRSPRSRSPPSSGRPDRLLFVGDRRVGAGHAMLVGCRPVADHAG